MVKKVQYDADGREIPDPQPTFLNTGLTAPESTSAMIQRLVRTELSTAAANAGFESFEEADDFDVEDEFDDPTTPFEMFFDPQIGREISADMFERSRDFYRDQLLAGTHISEEDAQALSGRLRGQGEGQPVRTKQAELQAQDVDARPGKGSDHPQDDPVK